MEQQTAVEWLYNELSKNNTSTDSVIERINKESSIWKQAKQMEKEQHSDTWDKALDTLEERGVYIRAWEDFDEYWKGKFKNK
jgi:hypothetical protein